MTEIETTVLGIIKENNLDAKLVGHENDYNDDWHTVVVEVDRKDYDRAVILDSCFDSYSIRWIQRTPALVGAEVGDLVLIYHHCHADDEDSDIGLVSAKYVEEDGGVYYGCRYLKIGLNNSFLSGHYDFELTAENYGGYPVGFLRVLTPQEAEVFLRKQLDVAFQEEMKAVKSKYERSTKNLSSLVASLSDARRVKCEKMELNDSHLSHLTLKK